MNRKLVASLAGIGLAAMVAGPALAGTADGRGAQKRQLVGRPASDKSKCPEGPKTSSNSAQPNGFVIFNSNGQPGGLKDVILEVSLKNAAPGTYTVNLQRASMDDMNHTCKMVGTLTV